MVEYCVDSIGRQVLLESVIHLHHGGATAGSQAFDGGSQGDGAIGRGLSVPYAKALLRISHDGVRTAQHARSIDANHHLVPAFRPGQEHRIER